MTYCLWCLPGLADQEPSDPERELCRLHRAEHAGLSQAEYERMLAIEAAEVADLTS